MPGLLTLLAILNGRRQTRVVARATGDLPLVPNETAGKRRPCLGACLSDVVPALLGGDPAPLVLLLIFARLLRALMVGIEWAIGLLLVAATLLRAWLWCRAARLDNEAGW